MMTTGDITVLGMTVGLHMIEDIATGVPHGMVVSIPAEMALRSKDLWRAISQKQVFRLTTGSLHAPMVLPPTAADPVPRLIDENQQLQAALSAQQTQNAEVMAQLKAQADAIRALTETLANAPRTVVVQGNAAPNAAPNAAFVDGSAPAFIPSTIKPESAEVRIETRVEEAEGADIGSNRDRLRRLRQ
jgi:hypothetical protein